jgi:predicted DNA-binding transcriptional regulator AlpA
MDPQPGIEDLAEAIASALAKHLKPDDPNQLYDHADLARLFKVSRSTIFRRAKEENWPRTRIGSDGKTDRFSRSDIEAIKQLSHKAPPPPKTVPSVGTRARRKQ